ncbi:hypothetical protein [Bergeyella zoohelcum]|uniref:Uncharacterized protein n=1 Tax=Bergeyella zoohelcum TaxID=1015 RepID=A0A380ZV02_9FLAO|nr:hypothetical protein [Bergeyella zoohelcum]EKB58382.1 hypothetical protein HMPREF9700_01834 [Bergeyella zoohelcum CCUG 30536]SUV53157.1 Uncharacterised protein [Bergeyella zoohelcum]
MKIIELFPEVRRIEPPPKVRKPRRKSKRYTPKENRRRYRLHRKVRDLESVELRVRTREIILPLDYPVEQVLSVKELICKFKYYAPTILE